MENPFVFFILAVFCTVVAATALGYLHELISVVVSII
jgi:hypothetical protein